MPEQSLSSLLKLKTAFKFNLKKGKNEIIPQAPAAKATISRGLKVIEKYPIYEPFAQVVVVQDPKTGEHKYILDELQLDALERNVYNRILEILLGRN